MFAKRFSAIGLCLGVATIGVLFGLIISGCSKSDDTSSSPSSSSESSNSTIEYVRPTQPDGVTQVQSLDTLPKLDNGGKLVAGLHCEPTGFESRQGVPVLFSLRIPRPPDTILWIITVDPRSNSWRSTGEVAIVAPSGNEAVGPLYHFCDYGLTNIPVTVQERPRYSTEWVWLFSIYDKRLDDLARAITEKYRGPLGLPEHAYVTVVEWLATEPRLEVATLTPEINGAPIDNPPLVMRNPACLAAARAEFAAKKKLIDTVYRQSFENWTAVAGGSGPRAVPAIWQAVVDLRLLRQEKFGDRTATSRQFIFRRELDKSVGARMAELLGAASARQVNDRLVACVCDFISRGRDDFAKERIAGKTADKIKDWFVGAFIDVLAGDGSEVNLERLIEMLTRWGDALIDQAGYPSRPTDPVAADASDFRNLKASPTDGYLTGFAIKWDYENVLSKHFGSHKATAKILGGKNHKARCVLTLAEMRTLAGHLKIDAYDDSDGAPVARQVSSLWIIEYPALRKELEAIEKETRQRGTGGESAWFDQVAGPNKLQAAAALRLLMYDLRALMQNDKIPVDEREKSMLRMTTALMKSAPKSTEPFLKPFAAVVHYFIQEYADYMWPSHLTQLIDMLDNRCLRSALSLLPAPTVQEVCPNREKDLDQVLFVDRQQLPPSCPPGGT